MESSNILGRSIQNILEHKNHTKRKIDQPNIGDSERWAIPAISLPGKISLKTKKALNPIMD